MADSSIEGADGPVSVTIKVDGSAIADDYQILRIQTDANLGRIPEAQLTLLAGSIPENKFEAADGTDFEIGSQISMAAAYGGGSDQTVFKGLIVAKRMRIARGVPKLELTCLDKAAKLTHTRKSGFYAEMKASDVMSEIIGDVAGLTADITATTEEAQDVLRHACTDWGYLRSIADRVGHVISVKDGTVTSKPPKPQDSAVLTITLGVDLIDFDARVDAQSSLGGATGKSWDIASQALVDATGGAPPNVEWGTYNPVDLAEVLGNRDHIVATSREVDSAELTTLANARTLRSSLASIQGTCTFQGSILADPGSVIELVGLGDRFSGNAYVSGVRQLIEDGEWSTEAALGLPDGWNVDTGLFEGEGAAGLASPIHGIQIATVLQIHDDPGSKMRIKVSLPMASDDPPEVWARFASPYASDGAGIQFLPEVGDEVAVGFFNADPNAPVVLGSLHNPKAARAQEAEENNYVKSIVTKAELKIQFDDENKIITIETPGGHSVVLDDQAKAITLEDQTGNKIEMSDSGIAISSPKDITLAADGKIDVTATGDATVSGMNVTADAQTGFTGKGGASAEVSAGGQTTIKGAMVMIN